jgi:hypothetical protein
MVMLTRATALGLLFLYRTGKLTLPLTKGFLLPRTCVEPETRHR